MIPFSARERENARLGNFVFGSDPAVVETLEAAVADYHGRACAVAFKNRNGALDALFSCYAGDEVVLGAMGPSERFLAASRHFTTLRYAEIRLDGTLFEKTLARTIGPQTALVVENTFGGIERGDDALRTPLGDIPAVLDACRTLAPLTTGRSAVWSFETLMPAAVEAPAFVLTDDETLHQTLLVARGGGRIEKTLWNYDLVKRIEAAAPSMLAADVSLSQVHTLAETAERLRETAFILHERLKKHHLFDLLERRDRDAPDGFTVLLTPPLYCPKEDIFTQLTRNGVEAAVCCKPVYKTTAYKDDGVRLDITEDLYKALLQLPCHHRLSSAEIETVAETFLAAVETHARRGCRF